jgi:ceramide glucosyltransferase
VVYLRWFRSRSTPASWPSISILKPLAGLDDELELNLESHLALDYPGEWEILLGVRTEHDPAYALAKAFAEKHAPLVRLVMQEGEPGLNPKVNQLITLTRHARFEIIALTDSNVRVSTSWLREHALYLGRANIGLTSHGFVGVGEATFGSALDNLTLTAFFPNLVTADVLLRVTQIVSKSLAIKREALQAVGGWEAFKDLLAEDQRLGNALTDKGYRTAVCPTPVQNVQKTQSFAYFGSRHTRWAMIRFKVLPVVWLEPLLNPFFTTGLFLLTNGTHEWAWWVALATMGYSMLFAQVTAVLARGYGFAFKWVLLVPLRDAISFAAWVRGFFITEVTWRGNVLKVGQNTQLTKR